MGLRDVPPGPRVLGWFLEVGIEEIVGLCWLTGMKKLASGDDADLLRSMAALAGPACVSKHIYITDVDVRTLTSMTGLHHLNIGGSRV